MSNKKTYILWTISSIIIFISIYIAINDKYQAHFINILCIVGFVISVVGLYIAYSQILSLKKISEDTKAEVEKSVLLNNNILLMSELSSKTEIVNAIEDYLKGDKYDICILRMKDLQITLNSIKNQEQYYSLISKKSFQSILSNFNIDLYNIQSYTTKNSSKYEIDKILIIKHLNDMRLLFNSVEIKIKNS